MIQHDIAQWKRRQLTPIGRICIVKALLLSKLVHLFIALPNAPPKYIDQLNTMLFEFVWGNKRDKVKRTKLVQSYANDGMGMVNIVAFIDSMKIAWLKRLANSKADWTALADLYLPCPFRLLTYGSEKLKTIRDKATNPFYADMLSALIRFNREYKPSDGEIMSEPIWFSNHTKFTKTIVREWDNRGLRFISDLFDPTSGNIISKEQLENKFQIRMTFLCYTSLIRSLPCNLRVRTDTAFLVNPNIPYKISIVLNKSKVQKQAYNTFISALARNHANSDERVRNKWTAEVGNYVKGSSIELKNATTSSYLFYLHYRIITRIYATNKFLVAANITQSDNCSFCKRSVETIFHLFWSCPKVEKFIKDIITYLRTNFGLTVTIGAGKWFFLNDMPRIDALIITLSKYIIHKARLKEVQPSLAAMINALKMEAEKEYFNAQTNNSIAKFENKWGELKKIRSAVDDPQGVG